MIAAPIAWMVAFFIHPQFWTFEREGSAAIQYQYIQDPGWQIGHVLVYLTLPLFLLGWVQLARLVRDARPVLSFVGVALTWVGYTFVAGNFGSVMAQGMIGLSLPEGQAVPVIQLILESAGLMQITFWGQMGSLLGPVMLGAALMLTSGVAPRWRGACVLGGNLIIAVFIDIDGIMIWGALLILIGLWPVAIKLLKEEQPDELPVRAPIHAAGRV